MLENICETTLNTDLCLYYCGKRLRCRDHSYGPEVRGYHLFVYIKEGSGALHTKKGDLPLKAGDLLIMFPGEKVHYTMDSVCSLSFIGVHGKALDGILAPLGVKKEKPILSVEARDDVERLLDKIYAMSYESAYSDKVMLTGMLYAFFGALLRAVDADMRFDPVQRAAEMMRYNYNLPLTVDLMAKRIECNPSYLSRAFKEKMGQSPKDFLITVRMEKAAELLALSKLSIGDVSASVGIEDPLYFSRIFHQRMGMTPSDYRKENKQK